MSRPIYVDQLIRERIVPKSVVAYIKDLEMQIDDLQEDLDWYVDNYIECILGDES